MGMRDDVLKRVPLPSPIRTWMRRASREADANPGRSRTALRHALMHVVERECSARFLDHLRRLLTAPVLGFRRIEPNWKTIAVSASGALEARFAPEMSLPRLGGPRMTSRDAAARSLGLDSFALLAQLDPGDDVFRLAAWELASHRIDRLEGYTGYIHALCRTFAREWAEFKERFARTSLLRCHGRCAFWGQSR